MYSFGPASQVIYDTLHPSLQELLDAAIQIIDFSLVSGHRSYAEQDDLFYEGDSRAKGGESPHNNDPSTAVDIHPYPEGTTDPEKMGYIAGIIRGVALERCIDIRWGGDWDSDGRLVPRDPDESLNDMWHIELIID